MALDTVDRVHVTNTRVELFESIEGIDWEDPEVLMSRPRALQL